jgi:hypothetical protein
LAQSVVIAETQGRRQTFRRSQLEVYFEESPQSAHRRSVAVGRGQQNAEVRSRKIVGEEARTHHDQNITLVAKLVVTQRLEPVSINSTVVKDFRKVNWVLILRS